MQIGNNIKGITKDTNDLQKSEDSYSFVLNGSVEHFSEDHPFPFIGNTPSNIRCLEFNSDVVGVFYIPELDFAILAFNDPTENTQTFVKINNTFKDLGRKKTYTKSLDNCVTIVTEENNPYVCSSQTLLLTSCFQWSPNHPLQFEYKITDCTLNLYFINGLDYDRFVYFDLNSLELTDDFKVNNSEDDCDPGYVNELDCEKSKWYPNVALPCIKTSEMSGGSRLVGKYSYLLAYSTNKGVPLTSFCALTQGTNLFTVGKENSERGVKIEITGVTKSSRYRYYTLVAVESTAGGTVYRQKGIYPVSQTIVYDLDNSGEFITLQELLFQYPFYKNSESFTVSNNILLKANLSEFDKFNLQPVISQVQLRWVTKVLKEGDYKKPEIAEKYVSYMRDEVYSFGIEPIISNLEKAPTFLCVGPAHTDPDFVTDPTTLITDEDSGNEEMSLWKVRNTTPNPADYETGYVNSTSVETMYELSAIQMRGKFGYHKSTELYPNEPSVWGDLCGQPIRHFRFPDHTISKHHSDKLTFGDDVYIFPLGVTVISDMSEIFDSAVTGGYITQDQRDRIVGWKLVRGNRLGNKTVVAKGLLYDMWKYDKVDEDKNFPSNCNEEGVEHFYPNYPFNDLNEDKFLASTPAHYKTDQPQHAEIEYQTFTPRGRYTFHSPDTHFTEPDLGTTLKIEAVASGDSQGFFNIAEEQAEQKLLSWKHYNIALSMGKWIANTQKSAQEELVKEQASNIGTAIGGTVGAVAGLPAVGSALGGILGSMVGGAFYKNSIIFKFTNSVFKASISFSETDKFITIFKNIIKYKQYHYQYQAVGRYNVLTSYAEYGKKQRRLIDAEYLNEGKYTFNKTYINNFNRESSVYLRVENYFDSLNTENDFIIENDIEVDQSRVKISDNSVSVSTIIEEGFTYKCSKWFVERASTTDNILLGVWGVLCTPQILTPLQVEYYSEFASPGDETFFVPTINSSFNGITHVGLTERLAGLIKIVSPLEMYIIEELILAVNTYPLANITPDDIEKTEDCYRELIIRPTRREIFDADETNNVVRGEEHISFGEVSECAPYSETVEYKEKRGCNCNKKVTTPILSYYGSIKEDLPSQYGTVYDINWVSIGSGANLTNESIFGGDTFINRFSLKRKHSFFNLNTFGLPKDFEINYSMLANAAYPVHYFDVNPVKKDKVINEITGLNLPINYPSGYLISKLFPVWGNTLFNVDNYLQKPKYHFDCIFQPYDEDEDKVRVEFASVEGLMYLYNYGIASFIVESAVNVDLRNTEKGPENDFYPHTEDLATWLQEKNVRPVLDNSYIYDKAFSKQAVEEFHYLNDINFKGNQACKTDKTNRVIYTSQAGEIDDDDYADNFLINKALDYYDFTRKNGKITSIEGLEGDKVLVRQEDASSVFGAYIEINTNQSTALISAGSLFKNKPVEFSRPTLGYLGSQHKAILHTPFGHVTVDAKRGHVFLLSNNASKLDEISNKGMKHWFKENLPFTLKRHFPEVNVDNALNGVGISLGYDSRFNSFYLTKLDYVPLSTDIGYNAFTNSYFLISTGATIQLDNPIYFCNKSFTLSYNFYTEQWQSFHSFTPRFYIDYIDHFDTGIKTGLWKHNVTNKDYQRYYDILYPFIVETITKADLVNHVVKNVNFMVDASEYFNDTNRVIRKDLSFNKAVVYNEFQNSGLLELENIRNNLYLSRIFPIIAGSKRRVSLSIKENYHSFNQFKDIVANKGIPLWENDCANVDKKINNLALDFGTPRPSVDYIRSMQNKVRLIQDKEYAYQFIFKGTILNDGISRRT